MDFFQAIILSVVEGVSEFLPISSTGHLILISSLLKIPQTEFVKSFEIFIQLGAILGVVVLYHERLLRNQKVWKNVLAAFIPRAIIGFLFYKFVKTYLLGNDLVVVLTLFVGGLILIGLELIYQEREHHVGKVEDLTLRNSFLIGLAQSISIIPGVSRSAATIMGGLFLGTKRQTAVEFSFLLAIPTMLAATGLDLVKSNFDFSGSEWMILIIGFVGSFITALLVVKWFLKYIKKNNFILFGVYRIIVAIIYWSVTSIIK